VDRRRQVMRGGFSRRPQVARLCPCCDRLYFAISEQTPADLIPKEPGLIMADPYGAEIAREAELKRMAPASRRALLLRFAQAGADRRRRLADPAVTPEV
jgi:hypothetical protein